MPANVQQALDTVIRDSLRTAATAPQERLPEAVIQPRWTLKRLVEWVKTTFGIDCCRDTLRKTLKDLGFSWKKARKLLNKANPAKRAVFLEQLQGLLDNALHQQCLLVYIDEAHIHLDTDEGYGWSVKGERFWVSSSSPGLKKVSFYGLYIYDEAQVRTWPYEVANQTTSIDVLERLRAEFPTLPIKLVWDGAPYHRALSVHDTAQTLDIDLCPLPAYSPDFMPVEHLWHWLREDLTYHTCYNRPDDLIAQVELFQARLNQAPLALSQRLWVTTQLDPEIEKLRFST
ncbi:MAG: IS630 family transposase [Phormidesmis priestleyi]|uniref:IS630 family transposase n=1 Tax=Phormidesmis priestleyi TaxID=268141 RepID=A0A2W4ZIS5_9CYAN|nr:MAG: IS630 family transposase [Phormidesmis priestleyi]